MEMDNHALLTVKDVAERLNVCKRTVDYLISTNQIPIVDLMAGIPKTSGKATRRCIRIWPDDLEKFIQERREQRINRVGRRRS